MSERINFYGIEEVAPTHRRRVEYYPRVGGSRRQSGWLKASEYHRLLERERRAPWTALLGALMAGLILALALYLIG